jgi:hypothetical protein
VWWHYGTWQKSHSLWLVPSPPVISNHIICAFQQGHQAFRLVKVKTTNDNTYNHIYPYLPILQRQTLLIMGRTCSVMLAFETCGIICFPFYILVCFKALRWWGVTRSTQPHILVYMFCPFVISTPLLFTWRVTSVNFQKDTFLMYSSHNFTPKRNELLYKQRHFKDIKLHL